MRKGARLGLLAVGLLGISMVLPFLYMISTALMDEFEVLRYPPALVPVPPRVGNFPAALTALPFRRFFVNSGVVSLAVVASILGLAIGASLLRSPSPVTRA